MDWLYLCLLNICRSGMKLNALFDIQLIYCLASMLDAHCFKLVPFLFVVGSPLTLLVTFLYNCMHNSFWNTYFEGLGYFYLWFNMCWSRLTYYAWLFQKLVCFLFDEVTFRTDLILWSRKGLMDIPIGLAPPKTSPLIY